MKLNEEHMEKLGQAFFKNLTTHWQKGYGIGLDPHHPFGDCGQILEYDILDIIGIRKGKDGFTNEQMDYAMNLYENLIPWLQERYINDN